MKRFTRLFAAILAAVAALSGFGVLPPALAAQDTVTISSAEDFADFSRSCRLDTWSQGKTVTLQCDIDLSDCDWEPVPTFGGEFDGGGHTISGAAITGGGSSVGGLFRYVQPSGVIKRLNVRAEILPQENADSFGGIAGSNSGIIRFCSFTGFISGSGSIGGIAGINEVSGTIYGCEVSGSITGTHYTGGVAGQNLGAIVRCTSDAAVNTTNYEESLISEDLSSDWSSLISTDAVTVHTDTGGIAGFSSGVIQSCVNNGDIGYQHVGYNVGGIAGRQCGGLDGCRNNGSVNGRKDVGGIVGQMAPNVTLDLSGTSLSVLESELDVLHDLINATLSDVDSSTAAISDKMTSALGYTDSARVSASELSGQLTDFVDGNVDSVNTLIATVVRYVGALSPVMSDLDNFSASMSYVSAQLKTAADYLDAAGEYGSEALTYAQYAADKISEAAAQVDSASAALGELAEQLNDAIANSNTAAELIVAIRDADIDMSEITTALSAAANLLEDGIKNGVSPCLERLDDAAGELQNAKEPVSNSLGEMETAFQLLSSAFSTLEKWTADLGNEEPVKFYGLGSDFQQSSDRLNASLEGLSGELQGLNTAVASSSSTLTADLRAVNDQFFKVMDMFIEMLGASNDVGLSDFFEDISDDEIFSDVEGKVSSCENAGSVYGDVNVGGVAGSMAIEYDLDPEDDITSSGATTSSRYLAKAVLLECKNLGEATSKKDYAGGLVGRMDLGTVYGCESYGAVKSESGSYVGGVAGESLSAIRSCWVICRLSGGNYVGGVAGLGKNIYGCRTLISIGEGGGWTGAVAGSISGEFSDNVFVHDELGGVDGISYAGKAEPVSYETLAAMDGLPEDFSAFTLTFVAGGDVVSTIRLGYGEGVSESRLPAVPVAAGQTGVWEAFDFSRVVFPAEINAVYTDFSPVISSDDERGGLSLVLAEGSFLPDASVTLSTDGSGSAPVDSSMIVDEYTVSVYGISDDQAGCRLHCLLPDGNGKISVWLYSDGEWQRIKYDVDGSYAVFDIECGTAQLCLVRDSPSIVIAVCCCGAAVLAMAVAAFFAVRRSRRKKTSVGTEAATKV